MHGQVKVTTIVLVQTEHISHPVLVMYFHMQKVHAKVKVGAERLNLDTYSSVLACRMKGEMCKPKRI